MEVIEVFLTEYDEEKQRIIEEKEREEELRESREEGKQNERKKIYFSVQNGIISAEIAAQIVGIPIEEFLEEYQKAGFKKISD